MKRTLMTVFALTAFVLLSAVVGCRVMQRLGLASCASAWQFYQVRAGEDLYSVSVLWDVSPDELRYLNNLTSSDLQEGQVLKIPLGAKRMRLPLNLEVKDSGNTYTVKAGEDVFTVAVRLGISPGAIRELNKLEGPDLEAGQVLKIPEE